MENNNDKSKTVEFRPVKEEKQQINRAENDVYSSARRSSAYEEESDDKGNRALIYLAIVLAVLLIVAIVAGVIILGSNNDRGEENIPENPDNAVVQQEEKPEEKPQEEKEVITSCDIVFYGDSVIKKSDGYTILADLYDSSFKKIDNRKLVINDETDIRENGKRLSAEGLVYAVESMAGEGIVFEGKIRESDNVVLSLSYEGSFREEIEEEIPEEEAPNEDLPEENIPPANEGENTPPEENNTTSEGIVDGI